MANESYEDFARALQTEYEDECGVTFGRVPITAFAKLVRVVDGGEQPIGRAAAEELRAALVEQELLDADGRIQPAFDPRRDGFALALPPAHEELAPAVIDLLSAYQLERHIRRDRDERPNRLRREVTLTPEFKALWDRIKPKTTYRVEFDTEVLVRRAVDGVKRMPAVEKPRIRVTAGRLSVEKGGVATAPSSAAEERVEHVDQPIPDVLAYLQNETELTRSTLVRILRESGRLGELFNNPQHFLDAVAATPPFSTLSRPAVTRMRGFSTAGMRFTPSTARRTSTSVSNSTRYVVLGLMRSHRALNSGVSVTSRFRRLGRSSLSRRM